MYDELGNIDAENGKKIIDKETLNSGLYDGDDSYNKKVPLDSNNSSGSAVLPPSSVVHRSSPQVQIRQIALNPTTIDTDKDTQKLVEEDKSEC